nr:hypothetical protein [Tanacetum cinerariifolium]
MSGPYKPTTVLVQAVEATNDSLAVPEHTIVKTPTNMSPKNKAHFLAEKEMIHLILTGIGDDIYLTFDACQTTQEMWEAIESLIGDSTREQLLYYVPVSLTRFLVDLSEGNLDCLSFVIVEPLRIEFPFLEDQFQEKAPKVPMADNRTMAELLQAPTEGYEDAIFFPPSKTTNLCNEITRFQQRFDESFYEAWEHFNDLLRACPHHEFSELHQLDTFYNALNVNDKDSLNSAADGNFLDKMPREGLKIIESKSKVRQSRAKAVVAKVGTSSSTPAISSDVAELKDMVKALLLDKINQSPALTPSTTPASVKAVEPNCVTCGGAHSYQNCPATHENAYQDNIQEYVSQAATANYNQGNTGFRPQMVANQIRPLGFPPYQNNQNNFNGGNNFNQNRGTLLGNTITNPKEEIKGITTRSGVAYQGPKTPSLSKQGTKVTKDQVQTPSSQNTTPVQPSVIQSEFQALVSEPIVAPNRSELRAEKLARNANPLALVATAQASQDQYYQTSRSHRSSAPSPEPSIPSRSHLTTRHKGKEIAKPTTPLSETASEEDSDPEQAQRDTDMQKNLALIAKYFKKIYKPTNKNLETSSNSKNKNMDTTPRFKNDNQSGQFGNQRTVNVVAARKNVGSKVVQQSGIQCFNCKEYGHFAKECRKPKRVKDFAYHKEKMLLCKQAEQGVPLRFPQLTHAPIQSQWNSNTCLVETDDSNVILDSPDICEDDIQNEQNDVESDDEQTSKYLGESISVRDSCLVSLQTKQTEFEKYKAFNDRTVDYDKLKRKLNEALGHIAYKDTVIREGLKTKAYELSVVKEKHYELMKQSLLTKSHYEGLVKQKTKVIMDLKLREEHDIKKMLLMEKQ